MFGLSILRNPAGTYSFVGRVPVALAYYHRERGGPLTSDEARAVVQCGPGLFRWCGTRTYLTREAAEAEASAHGYIVEPD